MSRARVGKREEEVIEDAPAPPFSAFLQENREVVFRYLRMRVGPHDVEDCFQETFLAALRSYPRLSPNPHLRAWVLRIAERKALDVHRARSRRPSSAEGVPEQPAVVEDSFDPQLWDAVRRLPPKQMAAVALRFIGDLPYVEVARALGGSEEAARQNVRAGLIKLRKEWR